MCKFTIESTANYKETSTAVITTSHDFPYLALICFLQSTTVSYCCKGPKYCYGLVYGHLFFQHLVIPDHDQLWIIRPHSCFANLPVMCQWRAAIGSYNAYASKSCCLTRSSNSIRLPFSLCSWCALLLPLLCNQWWQLWCCWSYFQEMWRETLDLTV